MLVLTGLFMDLLTPFEGCWQRIKRAEAHRDAFAAAWNSFAHTDAYDVVLHINDYGHGGMWLEPRHITLPTDFSLQIGEILYQLKAALDGSIYASAILDSGQDPPPDEKWLEFPITNSSDKFKNCARNIEPLDPRKKAFIERVQPYNIPDIPDNLLINNFNRTLGILHDWARKDRHRKLHFTGSWIAKASPQLRLPAGVTLVKMDVIGSGFLEHASKIASFVLAGYNSGLKVDGNPNLFLDIGIDEVPPPCADNDTLGNRIESMIFTVKNIVGALESAFPKL
jgi:hypothetical protein